MTIRLGIVMDPIQDIHFKKDSSLAMLHAAQKRGWEIEYMELPDLYLAGSQTPPVRIPISTGSSTPRAWRI